MPAITVDNILTLPRLDPVDPQTSSERPVASVTTAPRGILRTTAWIFAIALPLRAGGGATARALLRDRFTR